jgi:hypothetical protein
VPTLAFRRCSIVAASHVGETRYRVTLSMSTRSALHGRALSVGWHTMDPRPVSERSNSSPAPASQRSMKDETGGLPKQRGQQGLGEPMAGLSWGVGPLGLALPRTSFIRLGRVPFHLNDQDALGSAGLNVSARLPGFRVRDRLDRPATCGQEGSHRPHYGPFPTPGSTRIDVGRSCYGLGADVHRRGVASQNILDFAPD